MIAQVHIVLAPVNNAVADDGDAVGHRQGSRIGPDAAGQASVLGAQIGLGASGGFGRFHQGCFQPRIVFARRTALALFATLLIARTDRSPGGQVSGGGTSSHRDAHFGSNDQTTNGVSSERDVPSYFIECLLYNVPNGLFSQRLTATHVDILEWLGRRNLGVL